MKQINQSNSHTLQMPHLTGWVVCIVYWLQVPTNDYRAMKMMAKEIKFLLTEQPTL